MTSSFFNLVWLLVLNLIICHPLYAKAVEQKDLNFPIKTEDLMKGETHYFFSLISPRKLVLKYPTLYELDSLSLIQENNVSMLVTKTVSVVNRPVGFFGEEQMNNEQFVAHLLGDQKIKALSSPGAFLVTVPGVTPLKYRMQSFFDADDLSTLPNSKVIRAVSAVKKLDVISQGASTIMITEKTRFTQYTEGAVTVSSYIPLKENKTMIISYSLWALKKPLMKKKILRANFLEEVEATKMLMENFK